MPQQNIVRQDGVRSTLISILKHGDASTLQVVAGIKDAIGESDETRSPKNWRLKTFADQSIFREVRDYRCCPRRRDRGKPDRHYAAPIPGFVAKHG